MSLNTQITQFRMVGVNFTVANTSSTIYDIKLASGNLSFDMEFFKDRPYDKAASGALIQRMAGYRAK